MAQPALGDLPIEPITAAQILSVLRKVEAKAITKPRNGCAPPSDRYSAYATAFAVNDPTFGLRGALIVPKTVHMPALTDWGRFAGLVRAIWACQSGAPETHAALKLMALLYPRPGELRLAAWREFDLDAATWSLPKERMKMRRPRTKPLPTQAVDILKDLRSLQLVGDLVFPSAWAAGKPVSENTINTALHIGTNGSG